MSSPSRPLAPHTHSHINSRSSSPLKSRHSSPSKSNPHNLHHTKVPRLDAKTNRNEDEFQIYEDSQQEYELYHKPRSTAPLSEAEVNDDKENVLQPKGTCRPRGGAAARVPLADLGVLRFPGFLSSRGQLQAVPVQLCDVYQPKHCNNESRTLHKFTGLPSFITPPRGAMTRILHRTLPSSGDEPALHDEPDELERRLVLRLHELLRRKRAMSVGVNSGKAHLVQKNPFHIYTH